MWCVPSSREIRGGQRRLVVARIAKVVTDKNRRSASRSSMTEVARRSESAATVAVGAARSPARGAARSAVGRLGVMAGVPVHATASRLAAAKGAAEQETHRTPPHKANGALCPRKRRKTVDKFPPRLEDRIAYCARFTARQQAHSGPGGRHTEVRLCSREFRQARRARLALALFAALAFAAPVNAAGSTSLYEVYNLTGYEVWFTDTTGTFVGVGTGSSGDLSGWYTAIDHSVVISPTAPSTADGGSAARRRRAHERPFNGGNIWQTNDGAGCTNEEHHVTGMVTDVTRSDRPGETGVGYFTATLEHYRVWAFGTATRTRPGSTGRSASCSTSRALG